jgi:purine-binding chemotaxis protein CheW
LSTNDTDKLQIIVFTLDDKLYAVKIGQIREITRMGEISPVPNSSDYILGVTNRRGQVTTVIDLRKRLYVNSKPFDKHTRMMIIENKGTAKGMVVDAVAEVTMLPKSDIEEMPEIAKANDGNSAFIKGIAKKDNHLIILVDLKALSADSEDEVQMEANAHAQSVHAAAAIPAT